MVQPAKYGSKNYSATYHLELSINYFLLKKIRTIQVATSHHQCHKSSMYLDQPKVILSLFSCFFYLSGEKKREEREHGGNAKVEVLDWFITLLH